MKFLIVFSLVAILFSGVICLHDLDVNFCQSDDQCDVDECCVKSYLPAMVSKVCKDMGDDVGDRCGGNFQCNKCTKGLECVLDNHSFFNIFRKGKGSCRRPAGSPH